MRVRGTCAAVPGTTFHLCLGGTLPGVACSWSQHVGAGMGARGGSGGGCCHCCQYPHIAPPLDLLPPPIPPTPLPTPPILQIATVITGIQVHNWGHKFDDESPNLEWVAPTSVYGESALCGWVGWGG